MPRRSLRHQAVAGCFAFLVLLGGTLSAAAGANPSLNLTFSPGDFAIPAAVSVRPEIVVTNASLLVTINNTVDFWIIGTHTSIANIFTIGRDSSVRSGPFWDLGDGVYRNATGISNFTAGVDPDYIMVAAMLTDGINEYIELDDLLPGGGGSSPFGAESSFLGRNPDLLGYEVDFLRLVIRSISFTPSNGGTQVLESYTWELWGHRLSVAFVPPTDPDGSYLIDRNYTNVNVSLAATGVAVLDWDGANLTMSGAGTSWHANVSALANGVHTYQVWATNAAGGLFATPVRTLSVGVGIWTIEHVGYGFWPSLAFSASGWPGMCYYGAPGLTYAARTPAGWMNTSLDSGGDTGEGCSLAIDSRGKPHISYLGDYFGSFTVRYAYFNGIVWSTSTLEPGVYTPTSIAINPATDEPMISYSQVPGQGLKLASLSGGRWSTQIVDSSFNGQQSALAIDRSGHPAIAYTDYGGTIRVAGWTGSIWHIATLDVGVTAMSIAFDAVGVPHVAYGSSAGLQYATWNAAGWSVQTVDAGRNYDGVSLSFDSLGRPHIGYSMGWGGDVRQAMKSGNWTIGVVSHRNGNRRATLATMPQDTAGVAFNLNDSNGDVVFATDFKDTRPPQTFENVDGTKGAAGWYRSNVTVTLSSQDDWSGVRITTVSVDGGSWAAYAGAIRFTADGRHLLEDRSIDHAGNVETIQATTILIDRVSPVVTILSPSATLTTSSLAVHWRGNDSVSGLAGYELSVDGRPFQALGMRTDTTLSLPDGTHTIAIRATDGAGNVGTADTQVVIDTNVFSPSGPYQGIPTLVLAGFAVGGATVFLLRIWRRRKPGTEP